MKIKIIFSKCNLILILLSSLVIHPSMAEIDNNSIDKHKNHSKNLSENQQYRGVFYGLLPCNDCEGVKTTLSLKNRNNYLIVTQQAKASAREYYEKGKYNWDDEAKVITLTPRKNATIRKYKINDDDSLTQLSSKGLELKNNQKNTSYTLRKRKSVQKTNSMHMH